MTTADRFATTSATYDRARRQLIPCFDRFYGTAVELLDTVDRPIRRVLDLGAGTGPLTAMVAESHPDARFVLLDEVPEMLDQARTRLGPTAAEYVVGSFAADLPDGPFDAVVSALAIHHLPSSVSASPTRISRPPIAGWPPTSAPPSSLSSGGYTGPDSSRSTHRFATDGSR